MLSSITIGYIRDVFAKMKWHVILSMMFFESLCAGALWTSDFGTTGKLLFFKGSHTCGSETIQ